MLVCAWEHQKTDMHVCVCVKMVFASMTDWCLVRLDISFL